MPPSIRASPTRISSLQTSIRLFVSADLASGVAVMAEPGQAHYLGTVMRRSAGDELRLFNGRDGEWGASIESLRKDRAVFTVTGRLREQEDEPGAWLAFAPLKRDATDLVVQKATELGASRIIPVLTARTNAARVNEARLSAIATEAAEQSERLTVPVVAAPLSLHALLAAWPAGRELFAAIERSSAPPLPRSGERAGLLIGPEGGFTDAELDVLALRPFVRPASFGPRILRAETAAIAGLALLQARSGG